MIMMVNFWMNPPSCPPLPMERSRDQEELIKFYMLNKMTYNYLVALGLTIEAENFRQTLNLNRLRCLTSLPMVDELLQHVAVQQQPNIEAQLFPTLADAIKNGTATTINAAATSAIDSATVPSCAGPPPNIAPTLPLAGPRIVNIGASPASILPSVNAPAPSTMGSATVPSCAASPNIAPTLPLAGPRIVYDGLPNSIAPKWPLVGPRILNHGASLGNTSMGCHFPIVAAQQHSKFFCANTIPTPKAARIIGNTSIMRYEQLQQRQHRHKMLSQRNLAAVVQNHTAIQGSKRARPDTFSTAGSSTNRPRTAAISSPSTSAIIAGCTTDLSDT